MTAPPFPDIASLWQDTRRPGPAFAPLEGRADADVVIVGGGYTGLSTARHLAQAGLSVVVLEASRTGWGASGRNGGVVSGKFRLGFAEIARRFGLETARQMHDLGLAAIEGVAETIETLGIEGAQYRATGALRCAHTPAALAALRDEAAWLRGTLGDRAVRILEAEETRAETGTRDFLGGMLNTHGGVIHPLNYVLGLAAGAARAGARICEESPVTALGRDGEAVLAQTPRGAVRARQVVIATNGYSDLTPAGRRVRTAVIPFRSAMIATEPLPADLARRLIPEDRSYTETRRMMRWFRKADGRLMYGGRGAFGRFDSPGAFAALETAMRRQFPELAGLSVTHRWSGLVAMTLDSVPHLGRLDARTVYCLGYNGTGVALASYIGRHVAALVTGEAPALGLLTGTALKRIPFYPVREPAVRAVAGWYQLLDALGR